MADRRHAFLWAIGWWILRRQVKRRATRALGGLGTAARPRWGGRVLAGLMLIGVSVGAFILWRRFAGGDDGWGEPPPEPVEPLAPFEPPAPAPAPAPVAA